MDHIKILVNGTNQEIKRKYFKLEDSQNICYSDFPYREVKMVNLEDGFAIKNNALSKGKAEFSEGKGELITSPPILKIRGTIIDVHMDTDSNLILVDSVEVSTSTAYTTVFEPYKNTDYLVYINSYVIDFQNKIKSTKPKLILKKQGFMGRERIGNLPAGWTAIQNGNILNLIDIAFDGGADASATHNLYAIDKSNKFYSLNIKLDGSVNAPITGNTIWSELVEINTDLASFINNGISGAYPSVLSAYGGALILTFNGSIGQTIPICISLNRGEASLPDWISNYPLASADPRLNISGFVWPTYVRSPSQSQPPNPLSQQPFWADINSSASGKVGIADMLPNSGQTKIFLTRRSNPNIPIIGYTNYQNNKPNGIFNVNELQNTAQNSGWGQINNVFTDSTNFVINSQSPQNLSNCIVLIDYQDTQFRYINYRKFDDGILNISSLGTIQIPMGLGVLQFAAYNGIMFCLTTSGLYFMRYTNTLDGTTPLPPLANARCCETGDCTASTLLTNQLNLWTDCSAGQTCNYTGKNTCTGPAPPGPKPTPTPTPSPSNQGFFSRIWGWIKEHWIISLTSVAVLVLVFILIIFIAVKSKQSSSLSGQFNQNLEILEQQKLASLLKPSK